MRQGSAGRAGARAPPCRRKTSTVRRAVRLAVRGGRLLGPASGRRWFAGTRCGERDQPKRRVQTNFPQPTDRPKATNTKVSVKWGELLRHFKGVDGLPPRIGRPLRICRIKTGDATPRLEAIGRAVRARCGGPAVGQMLPFSLACSAARSWLVGRCRSAGPPSDPCALHLLYLPLN